MAALRTTACKYFVMEHDNPKDADALRRALDRRGPEALRASP